MAAQVETTPSLPPRPTSEYAVVDEDFKRRHNLKEKSSTGGSLSPPLLGRQTTCKGSENGQTFAFDCAEDYGDLAPFVAVSRRNYDCNPLTRYDGELDVPLPRSHSEVVESRAAKWAAGTRLAGLQGLEVGKGSETTGTTSVLSPATTVGGSSQSCIRYSKREWRVQASYQRDMIRSTEGPLWSRTLFRTSPTAQAPLYAPTAANFSTYCRRGSVLGIILYS